MTNVTDRASRSNLQHVMDGRLDVLTQRAELYDELAKLDWEPVTDLIGPGQEQLGAEVENLRGKLEDIIQKLEHVI